MNYDDLAAQRNRRLERADAHITRCGECGAWQWKAVCTVNHDRALVAYTTEPVEVIAG